MSATARETLPLAAVLLDLDGTLADTAADLARAVSGVASLVAAGNGRRALERFARIPEHEWRLGGPQMLLLKGYLHFLNADPEDIAQLRALAKRLDDAQRGGFEPDE